MSIIFTYIIQLILSAYIGIVVFRNFDATIGDSLSTELLANGFDRSVFSDFLNTYPECIHNIKNSFFIGIIIYLLLSIFINGGLIANIKKDNNTIVHFINNGLRYYIKFLGISILSIISITFILAVIFIPFFKLIGNPLETFSSEKSFLISLFILVIISILAIGIIWIWSVLSRLNIVADLSFINALKQSLSQLKSRFKSYFLFTVLIVLFQVFMMWVYATFIEDWGAASWTIVLALICIQQIFAIVRIWLRCVAYQGIKSISTDL